MTKNLTKGSPMRLILSFGIPVLFGYLFQQLYNVVDTAIVGKTLGGAALAAVGATGSINFLVVGFCAGVCGGFAIPVAQHFGAENHQELRRCTASGVWLCLIIGAALTAATVLLCDVILTAMNTPADIYQRSYSYIVTIFAGLPAFFLYNFCAGILRSLGDSRTPVIWLIVSSLVNIALDVLFILTFHLDVFGAALATVLGNVAVAPFCLLLLFHPDQPMPLELRHLRVHGPVLWRLCRLAAPAASSQALSSLGFLVLQGIILSYGDEISAAFSIGNKVSNMLLMPVLALGSVLAAFVGQNIGAGNSERARQAYLVSRNTAFLMAVAGSLLLYPLRSWTVAALSNDAATQATALEYLFWVLLTQPLMALFQNYLGVFNGSGKTSYAFLMSTCRLWVIRLPILTFFRHFTAVGASGVWYAMNISNLLILLLGTVLYRRVDFTPCAAAGLGEAGEEVTNQ